MEENPKPKETPSSSEQPQAPVTTDDKGNGKGSNNQPSKQDEAFREQQSRADRANSENDSLREDVDFLQSFAYEKMRDDAVKDFLKEKGKEFPNVKAEDLKKFVSSPDEMEETAKYLQDKYQEIQQDTLASAREVPDNSITQAEFDKEKKALDESNDPNRFQKWLRLKSKPIRK